MLKKAGAPRMILVLGSGPDVLRARDWPRAPFASIVAINNAWQVRNDWDYLIHPEDFPVGRRPADIDQHHQTLITAQNYVPVQNRYGGFVYAGGTMAFTAGYWALGELRPDVIAFLGCDMVYSAQSGATHFYGRGEADPLRRDVTLQNLEAKSARLMAMAALQNCLCVNLSAHAQTRLVFPMIGHDMLTSFTMRDHAEKIAETASSLDFGLIRQARRRETELGYRTPTGRYWEEEGRFDAMALRKLDDVWLSAARKS